MKQGKTIRQFSAEFKKEKVKMIEDKQATVAQISKLYQVSNVAVYRWLHKYGTGVLTNERVVVEKESEARKTLTLLERVSELERIIGQKQLTIDYLEKILEVGSKEVGFDLKKNIESRQSTGLKNIGKKSE
jgi:transposase